MPLMPGVSVIPGAIVGDDVALGERATETTSRGERDVIDNQPRDDR
jgi:hypothetical protein